MPVKHTRRGLPGGTRGLYELARTSSNYVPMMENADRLVEQGITTVEEVCRTIMVTD